MDFAPGELKQMRKVAVFDFDKTIVSKDTYYEFLIWMIKKSIVRILFIICFSPIIIAFLATDNHRKKAVNIVSFIATFKRKSSLFKLRKDFIDYFFNRLGAVVYDDAISKIEYHLKKGELLLILSGCPSWLLKGVIKNIGIKNTKYVGSRQKLILGSLQTKQYCYSFNKVNMAEDYGFKSDFWYYGYSDSTSDIPFISKCKKRYVINPDSKVIAAYSSAFNSDYKLLEWT